MNAYERALARIHDEAFGDLAIAGGHALLEALDSQPAGRIVDLGCGGGGAAEILARAGLDVVCVDQSEAFLELARTRVPKASFEHTSFVEFAWPACVGVCAFGEVLNYRFDERNSLESRRELFARIYDALTPGGCFLFDIAGLDRGVGRIGEARFSADNWSMVVETSVSNGCLTREIAIQMDGEEISETHELELIDPDVAEAQLEEVGFTVERIASYGEFTFPSGLAGFRAKKTAVA